MKQKHFLMIYTGGTIGMKTTAQGFAPVKNYLASLLEKVPALHNHDMPQFDLLEYEPLIDSADSTPELWNRIAEDIVGRYENYDGFLILHGTDTMAYTASALSFMLQGLTKPIVLTGSQVPLDLTKTDARENLVNALYVMQHYPVNEVAVFFGNQLLRGNRVTKVNAYSYKAFCSPELSPLVKVGTKIMPANFPPVPCAGNQLVFQKLESVDVAFLQFFPGISLRNLRTLIEAPLKAVIVKSYGMGNAPSHNKPLLDLLREITDQGILLVNSSQCLHAKVSMQEYATGKALFDCGAVSAKDMTNEAIIAKLFYLFSRELPLKQIAALVPVNIAGELTE